MVILPGLFLVKRRTVAGMCCLRTRTAEPAGDCCELCHSRRDLRHTQHIPSRPWHACNTSGAAVSNIRPRRAPLAARFAWLDSKGVRMPGSKEIWTQQRQDLTASVCGFRHRDRMPTSSTLVVSHDRLPLVRLRLGPVGKLDAPCRPSLHQWM